MSDLAPIGTLLIFPINVDASAHWVTVAKSLGFTVIGASSEPTKSDLFGIDKLAHLPYVTDAAFVDCLQHLIDQYAITRIFTAHQGVWDILNGLLSDNRLAVTPALARTLLCQPYPFAIEDNYLQQHLQWGQQVVRDLLADQLAVCPTTLRAPLSIYQYAGIHRRFIETTGQCDDEKLRSLCAIMRVAPFGDVVELGCFYGRSLLALSALAAHYQVGSTLGVDPWQLKHIADQGQKAEAMQPRNYSFNFDRIFQGFLTTVSQLPQTSYIRQPATEAIASYVRASEVRELHAEHLPPIPITGKVSVLHVDSNHDYRHAKEDVETWLPYLQSGGWLLMDDYLWAFGDGPKQVGDELLASGLFDCAFVSADTLFLHKT